MQSTDVEVRLHGDTAVVTGITTSTGQFMGRCFTMRERATDVRRTPGRPLAVRLLAAHSSCVGVIGVPRSKSDGRALTAPRRLCTMIR